MPTIEFTPHLAKHLTCPSGTVSGTTLKEALESAFVREPRLRGYILEDQGRIRQHIAIFVDNELVRDRDRLDLPVQEGSVIFVMQALSGG